MLREDLRSRPTIYQVLRESCVMQGRDVPIHDVCVFLIYSNTRLTDFRSTLVNPKNQVEGRNSQLHQEKRVEAQL